jgi:DNA-binding NarL/FixJ family response regulator
MSYSLGDVSKRILIADDHESVLRGIRAMLESNGDWAVCGDAMNGADAIIKAVQLRPDLVILDFAMPVLDGMGAAAEISRLLPGVPIVLHTMYGSEVSSEAAKHGVARVVEKAKSGALVATVAELLGSPATQVAEASQQAQPLPSLPAIDPATKTPTEKAN